MKALGLAIDIPSKKRPALRAVLLEDALEATARPTLDSISLVASFSVPTHVDDLASLLAELGKAATGRIQSLAPDIVVVRRADRPTRASNVEGRNIRLLATGAVTASARLSVENTHVRTGKECGAAYGSDKLSLDGDAKRFAEKADLVVAAAAALCGLVGDRPG